MEKKTTTKKIEIEHKAFVRKNIIFFLSKICITLGVFFIGVWQISHVSTIYPGVFRSLQNLLDSILKHLSEVLKMSVSIGATYCFLSTIRTESSVSDTC